MHLFMRVDELERIKRWHVAHRREHPLEHRLWDGVLTLWLMGWVGCMPVMILQTLWLLPVCLAGIWTPGLYVRWRQRVHAAQRLRCDWIDLAE
jgi:hypothetical protein